jgi:uncharacterized protein (TIGR03118 family)
MPIPRSLPTAAGVAGLLVSLLAPALVQAESFVQTNLVSDVPGLATVTDPNLVNPWGMSFAATSPFWVSDNGPSLATTYTGTPTVNSLVVSVPGSPTGQVNNSNTSAFLLSNGNNQAANFIFATQSGTILGWNGGSGTSAVTQYTDPAASYTGLAIGTSGSNSYLYAANMGGTVDVLDSSFHPTTLAGHFTDPSLPAGYVPYNIQAMGSQLYVTYVRYNAGGDEIPSGIVDIYTTNGTFVSRFSSSSALDAPWGITRAPNAFGAFGGDILIGNFLNGEINAFDPVTGAFVGTLDGPDGKPIADPGLWALDFRTGGAGNNPDALYFTAGINDEADGLFGEITETPEPPSLILAGLGIFALALSGVRARIVSPPQAG